MSTPDHNHFHRNIFVALYYHRWFEVDMILHSGGIAVDLKDKWRKENRLDEEIQIFCQIFF